MGSGISRSSSPIQGSVPGDVLLSISDDPDITVRDLALRIGITERAVIRIIGELDEDGYLERTREGRRNHYSIHEDRPLRHEVEAHCSVGDLIRMFETGSVGTGAV